MRSREWMAPSVRVGGRVQLEFGSGGACRLGGGLELLTLELRQAVVLPTGTGSHTNRPCETVCGVEVRPAFERQVGGERAAVLIPLGVCQRMRVQLPPGPRGHGYVQTRFDRA